MGDPVGMALKGDCRGFLECFADWPAKELLDYRTANGDSAIHIAAAMEDPRLIQEFLERLTPETRLGVLKQTDAFTNTGLHEAAVVENYDVASILVDFSRKSGDAYKGLVEAPNGLGETPVYRAAALGKTKLLQILAEQVGDLRCHFRRKEDEMTILHMAVIGQHFETAIWLLNHDSRLADKRATPPSDELLSTCDGPSSKPNKLNRLTCLELLALMPTAFKSGNATKKMRSPFHYRTWINCLMSGILIRKMCIGFWRQVIKGCSWIEEIWKEKKMHEDAVVLVKRLVEIGRLNPSSNPQKAETTKNKTEISKITLGLGKGKDILGKKLVDFSGEELIEVLREKERNKEEVDDRKNDTTEDCTLRFAASNGITEILEEILQRDPQAILSDVNERKEQNILHVAVKRRQHKVFELIMKEMQLYVPKMGYQN